MQAMVAEADAEAGAHPIKDDKSRDHLPTEKEKRREGAEVDQDYCDGGGAVEAGPLKGDDFGVHTVSTLTLTGVSSLHCKSCVISPGYTKGLGG